MILRKVIGNNEARSTLKTSLNGIQRPKSTTIKKAEVTDAITLISLLNEFAKFNETRGFNRTEAKRFISDGFGESPVFEAYLLFHKNKPAGFAITQDFYSALDANTVLYLEAIFIKPEYRSKNLGGFLFKSIAQKVLDEDYIGLSWDVNTWNVDAVRFYEERFGASRVDNISFFMSGKSLEELVSK